MCDFDSAAQVSQPGTGTDLHEQQPDTVRSGDEHIQKMPGCLIKRPMQISHVGVWNSYKKRCWDNELVVLETADPTLWSLKCGMMSCLVGIAYPCRQP